MAVPATTARTAMASRTTAAGMIAAVRASADGLSENDRIYRGNDGRYYCKRDDGTEGTIIGGLAGGVLGNIIAPGGSKTLGTILGAGAGALGGRAIDRNSVECD